MNHPGLQQNKNIYVHIELSNLYGIGSVFNEASQMGKILFIKGLNEKTL
jgi:hypothetical protein